MIFYANVYVRLLLHEHPATPQKIIDPDIQVFPASTTTTAQVENPLSDAVSYPTLKDGSINWSQIQTEGVLAQTRPQLAHRIGSPSACRHQPKHSRLHEKIRPSDGQFTVIHLNGLFWWQCHPANKRVSS